MIVGWPQPYYNFKPDSLFLKSHYQVNCTIMRIINCVAYNEEDLFGKTQCFDYTPCGSKTPQLWLRRSFLNSPNYRSEETLWSINIYPLWRRPSDETFDETYFFDRDCFIADCKVNIQKSISLFKRMHFLDRDCFIADHKNEYTAKYIFVFKMK